MIHPTDTSGLALAALALSTAFLAAQVRRKEISIAEMREILRDAQALVNDAVVFVVDAETAQAADDFCPLRRRSPTWWHRPTPAS